MPKFEDLAGKRFGRWTVIERAEDKRDSRGYPIVVYRCRCDCGTEREIYANSLRSGRSKSCGCLLKEISAKNAKALFSTHGDSKSRLYKIWACMRKRCENKNASNYANYGGRGITVCDEWSSFENFKCWSLSNGYCDNLSIDRIDTNGNYSPDNCRWVDSITQNNNRRSNVFHEIDGIVHTQSEWCRIYNVDPRIVSKRLKRGMSIKEALTN